MNCSIRYYVIEGSDIKPLSLRKHDLIHGRKEPFIEYAGKAIRYVEVIFELLNRKPRKIISMKGLIVHFDSDGFWDEAMKREMKRLALEARDGLSAASQLYRARYDKKFTWQPGPVVRGKIRRHIFKLSLLSTKTKH